MKRTRGSMFLTILFLVAHIQLGLCGSDTVPAFLWSSHYQGSSEALVKEVVSYNTMSFRELSYSVLSEGGWSELLCSGKNIQQNIDVALVFVGRKLTSSDISRPNNADPALVDFLKQSFTASNFSMAFPYIAKSDEEENMENSIISGFIENCGVSLNVNRIASSDACSFDNEGSTKLSDLQSVQKYLSTKAEIGTKGQTDLIVLCDKHSQESETVISEGEMFAGILNFLGKLGAKYTVLYVSDPFTSVGYNRAMDRSLAEVSFRNSSLNSTLCDGVCQIKSSLLEGVFVGIVLLIILLSGLCCMMGIDTPTRFETPQE